MAPLPPHTLSSLAAHLPRGSSRHLRAQRCRCRRGGCRERSQQPARGSHSSAGRAGPLVRGQAGGCPATQSAHRARPRAPGGLPPPGRQSGQDSAAPWEPKVGGAAPSPHWAPPHRHPRVCHAPRASAGSGAAQSFQHPPPSSPPAGPAHPRLPPLRLSSLEVSYYQEQGGLGLASWRWCDSCWTPWSLDH